MVGIDRDGKPIGNIHPGFGQFLSHLSEGGILSAHQREVVESISSTKVHRAWFHDVLLRAFVHPNLSEISRFCQGKGGKRKTWSLGRVE